MASALRAQTWVPEGLADLYHPATAWRRALEGRLARCLEGFHYEEVSPCLVETWDDPASVPEEAVVRVLDETGKVLALRSDFTPAVARVGVTLLERERSPVRLWYAGPVFRRRTPRQVRGVEMYQVGAEMLGVPGGDNQGILEILEVAAACLRAAGLNGIACALGSTDLPEAVLNARGAGGVAEKALEFLREGDAVGLEKLLVQAGLPPVQVGALMQRFFALGADEAERGAVSARSGWAEDPGAGEALLAELAGVAGRVFPGSVRVCAGLVLGPPYYEGPVFELYAMSGPVAGRRVGSGGQYRLSLGEGFTHGVGFALDLDELTSATD